jgi:hypothetical protein
VDHLYLVEFIEQEHDPVVGQVEQVVGEAVVVVGVVAVDLVAAAVLLVAVVQVEAGNFCNFEGFLIIT